MLNKELCEIIGSLDFDHIIDTCTNNGEFSIYCRIDANVKDGEVYSELYSEFSLVQDCIYNFEIKGMHIIYSCRNRNLFSKLLHKFWDMHSIAEVIHNIERNYIPKEKWNTIINNKVKNDLRLLQILSVDQYFATHNSHGFVLDMCREIERWLECNPRKFYKFYEDLNNIIKRHMNKRKFNVEKCRKDLFKLFCEINSFTQSLN